MARYSLLLAAVLLAAPARSATVLVYGFAPSLGGEVVEQQLLKYEPLAAGDGQAAAVLLARISTAAAQVCATSHASPLLTSKLEQCRRQAIKRAVRDVGSPALSAAAE